MGEQEVVGALLKARDKNELLKFRLREETEFLERQRKQSKHIMTNDIFEERKEAYRLQREVTDIELREKEKIEAELAKKRKGWDALRKKKTFLLSLASLMGKKSELSAGVKGTRMALFSPEKEYVQRNRTRSANEWKKKLLPELELNRNKSLVVLSSFWVGDPKAIDSVRRARKTPEEMGTYTRFLQGFRNAARKTMRTAFCSRQRCRGAYIDDAGFTDVSHANIAKYRNQAKKMRVKINVEEAVPSVIPTPAEGHTAGGVIKSYLAEDGIESLKSRDNSSLSSDSGIETDSRSVGGISRSHTMPIISEEREKSNDNAGSTLPSRPITTSSGASSTSGLYSKLARSRPNSSAKSSDPKDGFGAHIRGRQLYKNIKSPIAQLRQMSTNFLNREEIITVDVNKSVRIHKTVNFNPDAVEHKKQLARSRVILPDMIF